MKNLYVVVVLFSLIVVLGGYLVEPLLTLYLVFYRDLILFYDLPLLTFLFYASSSIARVFLALRPRHVRVYAIVSAILLSSSIPLYMVVDERGLLIVRFVHGFALSTLITFMWITLLLGIGDRAVLGKFVGVYNASIGLSTSIVFILSYRLVLDYGFNWLFIVAFSLCILSLVFIVFVVFLRPSIASYSVKRNPTGKAGNGFTFALTILVLAIAVFAKNLGYGIVKPYLPAYILLFFDHVVLAWSVFIYSGIAYVLGSLTSMVASRTSDNTLLFLLFLSLLVMSLGSLTYAYADTLEEFIVASIITSYTSAMFRVCYINYLSRMSSGTRGVYLVVLMLSIASLGLGVGSLLNILVDNIRFSFIIYTVLAVLGALALLLAILVKKILGGRHV